MFCYQCEQTIRGQDSIGCKKIGVCTKTPNISTVQDLIVFGCGISTLTEKQYVQFMFSTLTNVNHNSDVLNNILNIVIQNLYKNKNQKQVEYFNQCYKQYQKQIYQPYIGPLYFQNEYGKDKNSIIQLAIQSFKGLSAYADHTIRGLEYIINTNQFKDLKSTAKEALEQTKELIKQVQQIHNWFVTEQFTIQAAFSKLLEIGKINFKITELLNNTNAMIGGDPVQKQVELNLQQGPCILISGHDIADVHSLLQKCQEANVNVYTHGELYPANMYPNLIKYSCFKGNYGLSWWHQQIELQYFPGPMLFTTNCIMKPNKSYIDKVYSTGCVGYGGVKHIVNDQWDEIIQHAKDLGGFTSLEHCNSVKEKLDRIKYTGVVGFDHRQFLKCKDKIIQMIKDRQITQIYVIGGCDGFKQTRQYYKKVALEAPSTSLILTLACGRFRLNMLNLGKIGEIERLLDVGQCNDVYAAVQILLELSKELNIEVNKLPVKYHIQWYEQKAIVQFITLLALGIQNIEIGPTLPACIDDNVLKLLKDQFNVCVPQVA